MATAKTSDQSSTDGQVVQPPADSELTLEEFCARLSKSDKRVELIGGFCASEQATARIKDTEAQFRQRYDAFRNKPA